MKRKKLVEDLEEVVSPFIKFKYAKYQELLRKRVILINDDVSDLLIEMLVLPIQQMNVGKPRPITVALNTGGGSMYAMFSAVDAILSSRSPVTTVAYSKCFSAGVDIFLAGKRRLAQPHTTFIVHSGSADVGFQRFPYITDEAEVLHKLNKQRAEFYASRTNRKKSFWMAIFEGGRDRTIFADEALKLGVSNGYV